MSELKLEISSNNVGKRKLSRRNFLKLVGLGVGVGIVGGVDNLIVHPKNKPLNGETTNAPYSEQVEKMFNIKLSEEPSTDWDDGRVLVLGEFLSHLPNHFYSPQNGSVLEFELTRDIKVGEGGFGRVFHPDADLVTMGHSSFIPNDLRGAQYILTHELAHRVDFNKGEVTGAKIQTIINEGFDRFAKDAHEKSWDEFVNLLNTRKEGDPELEKVILLQGKLDYGLTSIKELIAVFSEIYTWGEQTFNRMGNWMGVDRTKAFYEVIKKDIFEGREYKNHDEAMGDLKKDASTGKIISAGFLNSTK